MYYQNSDGSPLTIVVFAAAHLGNDDKYYDVAYKMGKLIGENKFRLANGAGTGLMEATARGAKEHGAKVIGVGLQGHNSNPFCDVYKQRMGIHSRQSFLFSYGDAFIGLPGGMGTFYESIEIAELKKLGEEAPEPVIMINHEGFFEGFKKQLQKMRDEGFIPTSTNRYIDIVDTPEEAISIIKSFHGLYEIDEKRQNGEEPYSE